MNTVLSALFDQMADIMEIVGPTVLLRETKQWGFRINPAERLAGLTIPGMGPKAN